MDNKTLRELFENNTTTNEDSSPLERWFYELLNKKTADLTIGDISRMLRQDVFPDLAIPVTMNKLAADPFEGEMYDGELIKHFVKALEKYPHSIDNKLLKEIIDKADAEKGSFEWGCETDQKEFDLFLNELKNRL